jgi:hypothetical protein
MFIPRSMARLRLARVVFLALALVPTAVIGGWAAYLRSGWHRNGVRIAWQRALGLPVDIGTVEHPRPGVQRLGDCTIADADGRARLTLPGAELETTDTELRLRVPRLRCDGEAAALLAMLAADWLARGERFDRNCVIEIDDFDWADARAVDRAAASGGSAGELRVECVATTEARAVRVVRRPPDRAEASVAVSELRVVRTVTRDAVEPAEVGPTDGRSVRAGDVRVTVSGTAAEPIPFAVVAGLARDTSLCKWSLGSSARVAGRIDLAWDERGWDGVMTGRVEGIDLAACFAAAGLRAAGDATVDVRSIRWSAGRLAECEFACETGPGDIAQAFLEGLVGTLGCRRGGSPRDAALPALQPFAAAGALVRINEGGLEVLAAPRFGGALVIAATDAILWPPPAPVPVERLAWLLAPPDAPHVPAGGPGAWLMSIMPHGGVDRGARPAQATRPRQF